MTTEKSDDDIRREDEAHAINAELIGSGIRVVAGGLRGPFTVIVDQLSKEDLPKLIQAVREATGRKPKGEDGWRLMGKKDSEP